MRCPSTTRDGESTLIEYAADRLNRASFRAMKAHLAECDVCSERVRSQAALWNALDEWEPAPVSFDFDRKLYSRIEMPDTNTCLSYARGFVSRWAWRPALPLALTSLLFVAGFLVDRSYRMQQPNNPAAAPILVPVDAEQLDQALDDVQLLHQLDIVKDEAPDASHHM